jgi:hypothetical protein
VGTLSGNILSKKEILRNSWQLYLQAFPKVYVMSIFIGIISSLLSWVNIRNNYQISINADQISLDWRMCIVNAGVFFMIINYIYGIILYRTYKINSGNTISLSAAFIFVGKNFFNITMCLLLVMILISAGALLFIIPGVFLVVLLIMTKSAILFENKNVFSAIECSAKLLWGNWWRVFLLTLPFFCFLLAVGAIAHYAASFLGWPYGALINSFGIAFFYPLYYAYIVVQYNDLKERYYKKIDEFRGI